MWLGECLFIHSALHGEVQNSYALTDIVVHHKSIIQKKKDIEKSIYEEKTSLSWILLFDNVQSEYNFYPVLRIISMSIR